MQCVEPFGKNLIELQQRGAVVPRQKSVHQVETIVIIKHIEVLQNLLVLHIGPAERHRLVKDRKRVTHSPVGFLRYHMQGLIINIHTLLPRYHPKVAHDVRHRDPVEIVGLATRKNRRQNLMLLGRGKNEYGVCRRLLQRLEKCVESRGRKHVDLVYDVNAVLSHLRRNLHLVHQVLDVINTVVGRGVQFVNTIGPPFLEGPAGLTLAARLHIRRRIGAIDGLCEYPGRGCLPHSARPAEQVGVRQFPPDDGVLQGLGYVVLTDKGLERVRTIFSCRYDVFRHNSVQILGSGCPHQVL